VVIVRQYGEKKKRVLRAVIVTRKVSDLSLLPLNMGGGTPESARLLWPLALLALLGAITVAPICSLMTGGLVVVSGGGKVTCCPLENFESFSL